MTKRARQLIWGGLLVVFVLCICGWWGLRRLEEYVLRTYCGGNLRQIGQATFIYAEAHRGVLPDSMDALYRFHPDMSPVVRGCNFSKQPFVFRPPVQLLRDLRPDDVLAYEPEDAHAGRGLNVLFGDGRVEWLDVSTFRRTAAATRPALTK